MGMHFPAAYPAKMPAYSTRKAIELRIELLIAVLDVMDGDPDLEEDDPFGGNILDEPHDPHENLVPVYGVDQSLGPINEIEATRDWERAQRQRWSMGA